MTRNLTGKIGCKPLFGFWKLTAIPKLLLPFSLLLLGQLSTVPFHKLMAQQVNISKTVTGVVLDDKGASLGGATVSVRGTNITTQTNADGKFSITVPSANSTLLVTYVGLTAQELSVRNLSTLTIHLKIDASTLNDVVVVGYGKQKKATLTGAVEQITSKTFENRAVTNVGLSLQGATPGLVVTRSSPRPGNEGLAFQIRGITSVNGGSPLVVIDGVPAIHGSAFVNMNPDDIETISVIKDGATAIYGSQGANGVILVTTKRGKGRLKVDYTGNLRFTTNGITGYSPNMQQYGQAWLAANAEETIPNWWGWATKENVEDLAAGKEKIYQTQFWGDVFLGNANRLDEMFARRLSYQHNLSLSNSNANSGYRLSLSYADNQGNLATAYDGQKQYNLRFNHDYKISERLKLESGISVNNIITSTPSSGLDATLFAYDMPFYPAKNPFGQWNANFGRVGNRNAAAATSDGGRDKINGTMGRLDFKGTLNIVKNLNLEGMVAFQGDLYRRERYVIPVQLYDWFGNPSTEKLSSTIQNASNKGYETWSNNTFYQYYSLLLHYGKNFGKHNLSAAGGIVADHRQYKNAYAGRQTFVDQGIYDMNAADPTVSSNSGGKDQEGTYSYVGRANYTYAEKYLLELQGRIDGSSRFAPGYKFKNYGGFSAGWIFTKEDFFGQLTDILSFGKLRISYGGAGNFTGIGLYDYVSQVNTGTFPIGYPVSLQNSADLNANGLISIDRTWESVYQKNIALELNFLSNKLSTSFDYFQKDNKSMLVSLNYPALLGGAAPKTNNGHLTTKGWEVTVKWASNVKKLNYYISANMSNTNSLVKDYFGADSWGAGINKIVVGKPVNSIFLFQSAGLFESQKQIDEYYTAYGTAGYMGRVVQGSVTQLRPGDLIRVDVNGDGIIGDAFTKGKDVPSDLVYKGDANPHYVFGLTLGGNFKGFDLDAFFQGWLKRNVVRGGFMAYPFNVLWSNQNIGYLGQTWTEQNTDAYYPRLTAHTNRAFWNWANTEYLLQNSRYIRLKSLILGYTLPANISRKAKLERVRLYFSGNDLWETTSIKDNYDPEQGETTQNAGYPFYRTWSFGVNIGL